MSHALRQGYLGGVVVAVNPGINGTDGPIVGIGRLAVYIGIQLQQSAFLVSRTAEMMSAIADVRDTQHPVVFKSLFRGQIPCQNHRQAEVTVEDLTERDARSRKDRCGGRWINRTELSREQICGS